MPSLPHRSNIFDGSTKLFAYGRYQRRSSHGIDFHIHVLATPECIQALRKVIDNDDCLPVSSVDLLASAASHGFQCTIDMCCK